PLLADTAANRAQIVNQIDVNLDKAIGLLERLARFAMPSPGWGFGYAWRQTAFTDLLAQISALVTRWTDKDSKFNDALLAYDGLPPATSDPDRFAALQAAELLVSSVPDPLPATPAMLRASLTGKGLAFHNRLGQFGGLLSSGGTSFASLLNSAAALSTAEFDSQPFDLSAFPDRTIIITQDLSRVLTGQLAAARKRVADVNSKLTAAAGATSASAKVAAVQQAAKLLLGDDFQMIPEFSLSAGQGGEWANAYAASNAGNLFTYLKGTLNVDFPIDEWLYGAARVRPAMHSWEAMVMLASAFGLTPPLLVPIQLPFEANAPWLALQYPDNYNLDSERLLYTCAYSSVFDPLGRQC